MTRVFMSRKIQNMICERNNVADNNQSKLSRITGIEIASQITLGKNIPLLFLYSSNSG